VIAAVKGHEPLAPGGELRGLDRGLDGLGPGVQQLDAGQAGGQDRLEPVV
jgi:hypothetical protein